MTAAHTNNLGHNLANTDGLAELALFPEGDQVSVLIAQVFSLLRKASAAQQMRLSEQFADAVNDETHTWRRQWRSRIPVCRFFPSHLRLKTRWSKNESSVGRQLASGFSSKHSRASDLRYRTATI